MQHPRPPEISDSLSGENDFIFVRKSTYVDVPMPNTDLISDLEPTFMVLFHFDDFHMLGLPICVCVCVCLSSCQPACFLTNATCNENDQTKSTRTSRTVLTHRPHPVYSGHFAIFLHF